MAQSVLTIINRALRLLRVAHAGEPSDPNEITDAFAVLNMMLGQWNNKRLLLYGFTNELFDVTAGQGEYTIGPGGNLNTARPTKIDRAFMRYNATDPALAYDYALEIIPNDKYQEIFVKKFAVTYPIYLFYNNTFPLGKITLYPYPVQASKLGLSTWAQFSKFTDLQQDIDLPDGYESCLAYNLAVELQPEYNKELNPVVHEKAAETMSDLMSTNQQIAYMKADGVLIPHRAYNIYTGVAR